MKIVSLIARILLGLVFLAFGLNGIFNFMPGGWMPIGLAVSVIEVAAGLMLLSGRHVVLGLKLLLGPILVNIVFYRVFLSTMGLLIALAVCVLWFVAAWPVRASFFGLRRAKA